MAYQIEFHEKVDTVDLPKISRDMVARILRDIEKKLVVAPENFGQPLRSTLKGLRKLRVG